MSLPETIVAWRTSLGLQWWKPTEEWTQENEDFHADRRFYCASSVVSQLAIESTRRELKLAELEMQVKALKQGKRVLSDAELRQRREAAKKTVRGKNGKFVKAQDVVKPIVAWMNDRILESCSKSPAATLRRYIPERPWHWHLWMWLKVEVWEKFVLGRQS